MFKAIYYWLVAPIVITKSSYNKYLKYIFRFIKHWNTNQAWVKYLNSHPEIIQWKNESEFYLKFQKAYLCNSFDSKQKYLSFKNHYDWFFSNINKNYYNSDKLSLLQYSIDQGEITRKISLNLVLKGIHYREGESCITLELDNKCQYILSFNYIIIDKQPCFFIGGLQAGSQDVTDLETIKWLTKSLYGLRPKQLMLHGLSILCEFYQIQKIIGVSNKNHFYKNSKKQYDHERVKTNLDGFWSEFNAEQDSWGNWAFTPLSNQINLSEIPSKKRSQYRKRQVILDQLTEQGINTLKIINRKYN